MEGYYTSYMPLHPLHMYEVQPTEYKEPILNLCVRDKAQPSFPTFTSPAASCLSSASTSSKSSDTPDSFSEEMTAQLTLPRPFKAFPKNPLMWTVAHENAFGYPYSDASYMEFRRKIRSQIRPYKESRKITRIYHVPNEKATDPEYLEKRRKNNEAAKRSREARNTKGDEMAIRCAFLERENVCLKRQVVALENETKRLESFAKFYY